MGMGGGGGGGAGPALADAATGFGGIAGLIAWLEVPSNLPPFGFHASPVV